MIAATFNFPFRPGDTTPGGALLTTRNILSGRVQAVDLTGATIALTMVRSGGNLVKTVGSGLTIELATGAVRWALSPAESASLAASAAYTLKVTFADGTVSTFLAGLFVARP